MKAVKGMMESMMPVMMKGISSEEKQEMMVKMMPMMMADIDLLELMPKMLTALLPAILPQFIEILTEEGAHAKLVPILSTVMPNVCEVIDKKSLAEKKDAMVVELMKQPAFKEKMPRCFAKGLPLMIKGCFENFLPELNEEERREFVTSMVSMLIQYGGKELSEAERRELIG